VSEMNGLELELLFALRFRLNVTPDTFARYCAALEGEVLLASLPRLASPPEEEGEQQAPAVAAAFAAAQMVEIAQ
jgi:hypothetical protein